MSRWADCIWGDGTLWGGNTETTLVWGVEVDWDKDGLFDGSNEAGALMNVETFRGRRGWLNTGETGGFQSIGTGSARITLRNVDGRYDPWNTASALYPLVTDGCEVRVRVCDLASGTIYPIFFGVIADIQASNYQNEPSVVLVVEDGWRNLRRTTARVAMTENVTPDTAVGQVLDAAKWPSRWGRDLDLASDTIQYFWSSGSIQAATELERLAQSFLAYFYIDAAGMAKYITRTNAAEAVADLDQAELSKDLSMAQPWENRRSITRIRTHPLAVASGVTLWEMIGSTPTIVSGTSLVLWANYSYNNGPVSGRNVITPVASTDWTANTASGGGGTDKTGEVTLTFSSLGDTAKLIFSYSGGGTIYLTAAKIRGDALYEVSATDVTYPADPESVTDPREFVLDLPWLQEVNAARDFAEVIGPFLEEAHPFPTVKIESRPELQLGIDLFQLVTATIARTGVLGVSFRVAGISHQAQGSCQSVTTTLWLEPYIAGGSYWTWPITNFGVDTIFGW